MMKNFILVLTIMISMTTYAQKKDAVVATVNGTPIMQSVFEQTYFQNMLYVSDQTVTKEKVLSDLINREIGIQNAKKENLQNDSVVKYKMEDVLYHAKISKDLEVEFKKLDVSEEEIKNYYRDFPEYRTAHILMRMTVNPSKPQEEEALTQALKIYKLLQSQPDKFHELAAKYSQASVAPNGGDLDYQPAIRLAPEYFKAINGRAIGYITPPIRTQFGYHIVKVMGVHKFEEVSKPFYQKVVYDKKRDKLIAEYFVKERAKAQVKINTELLK